jgi:beta-lactamase class A
MESSTFRQSRGRHGLKVHARHCQRGCLGGTSLLRIEGKQMAVNWTGVEDIIATAEATGVTIGVSVIAPSGEHFGHNGARRFVAASTVKIAIMIELFRQIDAGRRSLGDVRTFKAADVTSGSGVIMHLHPGLPFTLGDLVYLMMSISDNAATNMLIDVVGIAEINTTMKSLGMKNSALGRLMRGRPMLSDEQENWSVCDEYTAVISGLLMGKVAAPESCAQMVALLEKQQNDRRIARFLPKDHRPRWGSKTGSLPGVVNDIGFIITDRGPMCIAVCVENTDGLPGEEIIGRISQAALAAVS